MMTSLQNFELFIVPIHCKSLNCTVTNISKSNCRHFVHKNMKSHWTNNGGPNTHNQTYANTCCYAFGGMISYGGSPTITGWKWSTKKFLEKFPKPIRRRAFKFPLIIQWLNRKKSIRVCQCFWGYWSCAWFQKTFELLLLVTNSINIQLLYIHNWFRNEIKLK